MSSVADRTVEGEASAGRVDLAVAAVAGISRAHAQRLIGDGRALVDGERRRASDRLRGGERVRVELTAPPDERLLPEAIPLRIAYEDEAMLIVDKPAGLVVHPSAGHATGTLVQIFVPIFSDYFVPVVANNTADTAVGVIEIVYNITPQWEKLWTFQWFTTAGIIVIFTIIISLLVLSSRKAESIIERQHEVNLELTAAAAAAEAENRAKSQFLANISHELRTPLNAIIGFSEVLAEGMFGDVNEKQAEYLRDILDSGRHLLSLINDILDLSKIEAGRMELESGDFDLPNAIANALMLVRERASRRGITLGSTIDERLGTIRGDERKVKQVLLNLLSNALKFTPEGGRVHVSAGRRDDVAEVAVADTGIGIAPADQDAVFEEFRQVGAAETKAEGTGLGLALSRKFIELHGGRIWVKSEVGMGSTFIFTLPIEPPRA